MRREGVLLWMYVLLFVSPLYAGDLLLNPEPQETTNHSYAIAVALHNANPQMFPLNTTDELVALTERITKKTHNTAITMNLAEFSFVVLDNVVKDITNDKYQLKIDTIIDESLVPSKIRELTNTSINESEGIIASSVAKQKPVLVRFERLGNEQYIQECGEDSAEPGKQYCPCTPNKTLCKGRIVGVFGTMECLTGAACPNGMIVLSSAIETESGRRYSNIFSGEEDVVSERFTAQTFTETDYKLKQSLGSYIVMGIHSLKD